MRLIPIVLACCVFLASCEPIKGAGRDIESVGEAIDEAVD